MIGIESLAVILAAVGRRRKEEKAVEGLGFEPICDMQTPAVPAMTEELWSEVGSDVSELCVDLLSFARFNKYMRLAGMAANQVGLKGERVMLDVCFVNTSGSDFRGCWVTALCPEIVSRSGGSTSSREGCLTWPGKYIAAERHDHVVVRYRDLSWKECEFEASGFEAKVWQHEVNHLRGVEERIHFSGEFRGVGVNDPCPCGSGKKLKKCCGR